MGLDRRTIARAALELVDSGGIDQLSMRRLAEATGTKVMTLYSYVDGKDDVIDAMYELMLEEVELAPADADWRDWVRGSWTSYRMALLRHPEAAAAVARRPTNTRSGRFAVTQEAAIGVFRRAGFSIEASVHAQRVLTAFVLGTVQVQSAWMIRAQQLGDPAGIQIPPGDFPHLMEAMEQVLVPDFDGTFELGLELILSGLDEIGTREAPPPAGHA